MTSSELRKANSEARVAVVGGGSIGIGFAIVFASAGHAMRVFEPAPQRRKNVAPILRTTLSDLHAFDLLQQPVDTVLERVTVTSSLADAVTDAICVQECAPENRALKESVFGELDRVAPAEAVVASSSSAMPASEFASHLPGRQRCLVVHPGNPPFLLRVAEVIPAPFTDASVVSCTRELLSAAGVATVVVRKEMKGFIFNRLQGAVLREAYCLVRDGVASVADIDRVVRDGLGLRWSVIGPFETADLNMIGGIARHAERLGPAYAEMGAERGQHDPWTAELVREVEAQRRELMPLDQWEERVRWRDRVLMALVAWRRQLPPS